MANNTPQLTLKVFRIQRFYGLSYKLTMAISTPQQNIVVFITFLRTFIHLATANNESLYNTAFSETFI